METFTEVLNKNLSLHPDPTKEKVESTLKGLNRLIDELARPENRDLMRFVFSWQKLELELDKLQRTIEERMVETPVNKLNQFLQQLKKKQ